MGLLALAVTTITFIITFDLIEPTIGIWFRTSPGQSGGLDGD